MLAQIRKAVEATNREKNWEKNFNRIYKKVNGARAKCVYGKQMKFSTIKYISN